MTLHPATYFVALIWVLAIRHENSFLEAVLRFVAFTITITSIVMLNRWIGL